MAEPVLNLLAKASFNLLASAKSSLINHQSIRTRVWANVRPITGWPRKHLMKRGKKYPEPHTYNYKPYLPEDGTYTIKPLPIFKMGGRDMETGHVVVRTLGGGNNKKFKWVDTIRSAKEDGTPRKERVLLLKYSPLHTPKLALVADDERTRWILATDGIKVGDVITTYSDVPRIPVRAKIGDAHPVGALPKGTKIHQLETSPGAGAQYCLVAGSFAEITNRSPQAITCLLPSGDSVKVDLECMAVVGQNSNVGHANVKLWCPQRKRWLGKTPRSGQWHRKDGYCGRKNHPPKLLDATIATLRAQQARKGENELFDLS